MKASIGIFITARLESSRLPEKHLQLIGGVPCLQWLVTRIRCEFGPEIERGELKLLITSADTEKNRTIADVIRGAEVFWGDEGNIPLRHLQAMKAAGVPACVSVDGDDLLCSPKGMRDVMDALLTGAPYVSLSGLPFGMNSFGYSQEFLAASLADAGKRKSLETGWGRIFNAQHPGRKLLTRDLHLSGQELEMLRFTLDYQEDLSFFTGLQKELGEAFQRASDDQLARLALDKGLFRLNAHLNAEYWQNFHRNIAKEQGEPG